MFYMFFPVLFHAIVCEISWYPPQSYAHVVASQEQMQRLLQQHIDPVGG